MYSQNLMSAASDRDIINYFRGYLSAPVGLVNEDKYNNGHAIQKSIHFIFGGDFDIGNNFILNIEAYFKKYPQLINFNRNKLFNEFDFPEQSEYLTKDFILEKGYSKGIEFTGRYQTNNLIVNAAYSYAITEREYENDLGEWISYYPHYDRRHNVNIFFSYQFGKDKTWEFNSRWNLGSGFPYTQTQGYFENVNLDENQISNYLIYNGEISLLYGQYNSGRLPVYHRLDMSLKRRFETF